VSRRSLRLLHRLLHRHRLLLRLLSLLRLLLLLLHRLRLLRSKLKQTIIVVKRALYRALFIAHFHHSFSDAKDFSIRYNSSQQNGE
jgi:hypothetical protein